MADMRHLAEGLWGNLGPSNFTVKILQGHMTMVTLPITLF